MVNLLPVKGDFMENTMTVQIISILVYSEIRLNQVNGNYLIQVQDQEIVLKI